MSERKTVRPHRRCVHRSWPTLANRVWPALFGDRVWPNRLWPALVFWWYGRLWPKPTLANPTLAKPSSTCVVCLCVFVCVCLCVCVCVCVFVCVCAVWRGCWFHGSVWGRRGFTRQPENSKRAHLSAPALQTQPKFHEKTPREGRKERILRREREKKARYFGPPTLPAPTFCRRIISYTSYSRTNDCIYNGYVHNNLEHNTMINIDTVAHMNMHYTQY